MESKKLCFYVFPIGVPFSFIRPIDKVYIHKRIKSPDISYQNKIFNQRVFSTNDISSRDRLFRICYPKRSVSIYIIRPLLTIFASFIFDESAVEPSVMIIHYLAIKTLNAERLNHILTRAFLELGQRLVMIHRLSMSAKYNERPKTREGERERDMSCHKTNRRYESEGKRELGYGEKVGEKSFYVILRC